MPFRLARHASRTRRLTHRRQSPGHRVARLRDHACLDEVVESSSTSERRASASRRAWAKARWCVACLMEDRDERLDARVGAASFEFVADGRLDAVTWFVDRGNQSIRGHVDERVVVVVVTGWPSGIAPPRPWCELPTHWLAAR